MIQTFGLDPYNYVHDMFQGSEQGGLKGVS